MAGRHVPVSVLRLRNRKDLTAEVLSTEDLVLALTVLRYSFYEDDVEEVG
jgi:hypothetical protein